MGPSELNNVRKTPCRNAGGFLFPLHQVCGHFRRGVAGDLVHESPQGLVLSFPLHQVCGPFSACGRRGLGARILAKPCSSVAFALSLRPFSACGRGGLGARIPAKSCSFVAFAPSLRVVSRRGRRGLGARILARPCSSVPFAPSLRPFSACGRRGLGARIPAKPCSSVAFAPSLRAFSHAAAGKRDLNHRLCDFCSKRSIIRVSIFPIVFNGRMNIDKF